jgi:hypothetical protein
MAEAFTLKDETGAWVCGAETRVCRHCGCHQREHDVCPPEGTRRGPCLRPSCAGGRCPSFEGRPHMSRIVNPDNGRCKVHGGRSLAGIAAPAFRGRGYSGALPTHLVRDYEAIRADPELTSLKEQIAVTDAMLRDSIRRLSRHDTVAAEAHAAWRALANGIRSGRWTAEQVAAGLSRMDRAMADDSSEKAAKREIRELMETLRKLKEGEAARLVDLNNTLTLEQAIGVINTLSLGFLEIIREHVRDDAHQNTIRRALARRLDGVFGRRGNTALGAGGGGGQPVLDVTPRPPDPPAAN